MSERDRLIRWLDRLAKNQKEAVSLQQFKGREPWKSDCRVLNREPGIHMKNVSCICEKTGVQPDITPWECNGSTADLTSFIHNGVRFYALEHYRGGWEDGTD